jgi:phosphoglycerate dehydrogenase-like enzyme
MTSLLTHQFEQAQNDWRIAVTSRSFSRNTILRDELLAQYPQTTFNDAGISLRGDELKNFLNGHDAAIIALEPIEEALLDSLPKLKVISKYGVGIDKIDLDALKGRGISLGWERGVNRRSVSELALAFMICSLRHINTSNLEVRSGTWRQHIGAQLTGKKVGIVGLGSVGKDLVGLLKPFNCQILAHDILEFPNFCAENNVRQTSLQEVLSSSDIVSLHVPLTDLTRDIIGTQEFHMMSEGSILINTARGGLVNETALKEFLMNGHLASAAFDVFAQEPPDDTELLTLPNFIATPHIGGSAIEAILAMGRAAIDQLGSAQIPELSRFT